MSLEELRALSPAALVMHRCVRDECGMDWWVRRDDAVALWGEQWCPRCQGFLVVVEGFRVCSLCEDSHETRERLRAGEPLT